MTRKNDAGLQGCRDALCYPLERGRRGVAVVLNGHSGGVPRGAEVFLRYRPPRERSQDVLRLP